MGPARCPVAEKAHPSEWLKTNGFHEIEADLNSTSSLLRDDRALQIKLNEIRAEDDDTEMTHSVAINLYPATLNMPQLTIVVIDTIPVELKRSYMVWNWFVYVLAANLLLVILSCGLLHGGASARLNPLPKRCASWKNITARS